VSAPTIERAAAASDFPMCQHPECPNGAPGTVGADRFCADHVGDIALDSETPAPVQRTRSDARFDRFSVVARAQGDAAFREGVLAAYRELGRPDLVVSLVQDLQWLDRFDPDLPPALNRLVTLGTVRRAPNGAILDLTRPLIDRDGGMWRWGGYTADGEPLVSVSPELGIFAPIGEVWNEVGPLAQPPAEPVPVGPCSLCGTKVGTLLVRDPRTREMDTLCAWCQHPEATKRAGGAR
jgi:hypothetical protein